MNLGKELNKMYEGFVEFTQESIMSVPGLGTLFCAL